MGFPKGSPRKFLERKGVSFTGLRVVDIGANVGEFTEWIAPLVGPTGSVLAIEPDPRCLEELYRRTESWPWVSVAAVAISAEKGMGNLRYGPKTTQSSLYPTIGTTDSTVSVPTCRLDDLVDAADVVKIDAQGGELEILRGAPKLLQTCSRWIVEVWPHGLALAKGSAEALRRCFVEAGFMVQWSGGVTVTEQDLSAWLSEKPSFANWLAVR